MRDMSDEKLRLASEANSSNCFSTLQTIGNSVEVHEHEAWTRITTAIRLKIIN
jgi:hypothetical protein